jgi:NAD(P)-dependent dehydrogenase (short-subunit alcohol dehydrogenase family)
MAEATSLPPQTQGQQPGREAPMHPQPDFTPRYPGSGRLAGKAAIITGGDSGIGRAIAALFAREGADVALVFLEERGDARRTAELVREEGRDCLTIAGDVGDESFCRRVVDLTLERFGRLDILVNNAAEQHPKSSIDEISAQQLARTFQTNIFGYFFMAKAALKHMKQGAAVINVTSVTAYRGSSHLIDYASTKGAIVAFTRSLAQAVVERGIRVNGVAPGPIWTPLIPSTFPEDKVASFGKQVPMKRPGQPNEVAPAALFLACEDASYMTGQVLHPNGGEIVGG